MIVANRRNVMKFGAAVAAAAALPAPLWAQASGRVVVIGGGFAGATCARTLREVAPQVEVILVEQNTQFVTCPFSNLVLSGLGGMDAITHSYDGLRAIGVNVVHARATGANTAARTVQIEGGADIGYDRLVVAPGVDFKFGAIQGYDEAAAEIMPHAWKAGPQTTLLRQQLEAMPDGGVFLMSIPANPFRCPPGPYERASLIAHYFKQAKPRSKILLLDAKDAFSKQKLFEEAWAALYPGLIEWIPFAMHGNLMRVDASTKTLFSEFGEHTGDVVNLIPPQRAGNIAGALGLTGTEDWCRINPVTFESTLVPGVHVLGDAAVAGSLPKSGFAASSQGKVCAHAIAALQAGQEPGQPSFINTCYSLVAPDYGISVADVFRVADGTIKVVDGAGGVSPLGASDDFHQLEANYARGWYASIIADIFG